ncbi:hypothetical protein GCM10011348_23020 [Marinobacterium nitratireducens]|uniref:Glutathione S-transferase n=1 Tax=Marinobacterium nitratireducens TaxID=518897 RepID=A0A918DT00_9GAMM|nr:glutathione S-transferase family protein [Marinobacterium nitratireducens]GGO82196.1 hypothetical protein GCM10011348_23020 [Marinobacterium nitratireducens]
MLKLYGLPLSNYYNIVKQAMLEKGIAFEEVPAPPSQKPEYLAKSPMGKIPCLETEQGFLSETSAILEYLEETHPVPKLYPAATYERAKAREIQRIAELYLDAPSRRFLGHIFFGAPLSEEAKGEVRADVEKGLAALGRVARFEPWVAGKDFSYADIVLLYCLGLTRSMMNAVYQWDPLQNEPELRAWLQLASERDHSRQLLAAQQQAIMDMKAGKKPTP